MNSQNVGKSFGKPSIIEVSKTSKALFARVMTSTRGGHFRAFLLVIGGSSLPIVLRLAFDPTQQIFPTIGQKANDRV